MSINANLYPSLDKTKLRAGDLFKGQAMRFDTPEVPLNRAAFLQGVTQLNTISAADAQRYGFHKELVFSSVQDLQTYIDDPQMPTDVDYIEFDFESVMTPQAEFEDPAGAVSEFASIVHGHGKKVTFAPGGPLFRRLEATGKLGSIAKGVDLVIYQGQNQLPSVGEGAFLTMLVGYHSDVRAAGVPLGVQLWETTNGCPTMVRVFNEAMSSVDLIAIGTHDDGPGANCVLTGLRK